MHYLKLQLLSSSVAGCKLCTSWDAINITKWDLHIINKRTHNMDLYFFFNFGIPQLLFKFIFSTQWCMIQCLCMLQNKSTIPISSFPLKSTRANCSYSLQRERLGHLPSSFFSYLMLTNQPFGLMQPLSKWCWIRCRTDAVCIPCCHLSSLSCSLWLRTCQPALLRCTLFSKNLIHFIIKKLLPRTGFELRTSPMEA